MISPLRLLLPSALALAVAGCSRPAAAPVSSTSSATPPPASAGSAHAAAAAPSAPAATASFPFATQTLTVPAGFTVELVAAPPLVDRPISMAYDEQGRLYVTDSSGLSDKSDKQFELKPHRIVRLEDTDGDGRFDKSVVFADRMMFPQGALFYEGSLYVSAPPHIWKLTDTNGDGVADKREEWWDGKTLTGCANDVHGPYLGPDGWFYWTKGAFAEQRHTLGNGKPFVTRAAHIFRSRPDGTGFEPVLTGGMDNPVGVAFSATGDRILSGTFFQIGTAGKRDGLIHAIYGGVYGKDNPAAAGHPRTGDLMPIMTHMGAAAPCGSTTYHAGAFGSDYTDNVFVCYFNLRKVSRHELVPDGATYTTRDSDFITSDSQDFRPTDVLEDADGSLLVIDTGGWYKICCPTSQLAKPDVLGGIYRIRKNGAAKLDDPRGLKLPWTTLAPAGLAKLLGDPRPYVQQRAAHLLGKAGDAAVPAVRDVLATAPSPLTRRNALWALARIERPAARDAVRSALQDRDASVVQTALHITSLWRDAASLDAVAKLLAGSSAAHARLAAETLGRIGDARSIDPIVAALRRLGDTPVTSAGSPEAPAAHILEHALIYALIEIGRPEPLLAHVGASSSPHVARAAMVALDQMENSPLKPENVIAALNSPVPMLKQTAGWVVGHHAEWGDALASFFRQQLRATAANAGDRAELQTQLAQLARATAIQNVLAETASDPKAAREVRVVALRAMATSALKETPASWLAALPTLLAEADAEVVRQAVATTRALPLPKTAPPELGTALARVGRSPSAPTEVRLDALATATPAAIGPLDPELFEFVRGHLDPKEPMLVRGAAATVLAKVALTPAQQLALADSLRTVGALEAPKLLPAFERAPNQALGLQFVAALRQSPGLSGVRPNVLKPLLAKYPAAVQQQGAELLAQLNADAARQNARIDELLPSVKDGDVRRGQAVFNSEKTACTMCHVIGYRGGRLGPDLTTIGRIRNERDLLEAVVFPSATFVRGFEPFIVTTKSGETHSGIVRKDAPDEVVLATGPESEQRIARSDIAQLQPGPVSPMPPGMDAVLSRQELADLVAFLKSRQ